MQRGRTGNRLYKIGLIKDNFVLLKGLGHVPVCVNYIW